MKIRFILPLVVAALVFAAVSCSDDDGTPGDPAGTVALNMLDEQNGKTQLEDSGIYIDKARNFVSGGNCDLFALGKSGGLGAVKVTAFENPASQAAVQTGYGYAAVRPGALMEFPSGKLALPIGNGEVNYLKFYAFSPLTKEDKTIGEAIKYVVATPESYGLPDYGSTAVTIDLSNYEGLGSEVSYKLPSADCESALNANGVVVCEQRGDRLFFSLQEWVFGRYTLYLRFRESYTMVYVEVI